MRLFSCFRGGTGPESDAVMGCIFDLDGTLLDTEGHPVEAVRETLTEMIGEDKVKNIPPEVLGSTIDAAGLISEKTWAADVLKAAGQNSDRESVTIFVDRSRGIAMNLAKKSEPMEGAEELTAHLYATKVPIGIATNSNTFTFDIKMATNMEMRNRFNHVVCRNTPGVRKPKPAPDTYLIAAREMNLNPRNCLAFEDSLVGAKAALTAGMRCIAVTQSNPQPFEELGVDEIVDSMDKFDPGRFGLPPRKKDDSPEVGSARNVRKSLSRKFSTHSQTFLMGTPRVLPPPRKFVAVAPATELQDDIEGDDDDPGANRRDARLSCGV